jgi:hypothetical protein
MIYHTQGEHANHCTTDAGNNIPIKPNAAPLNFALKLLLATTLKQNKYYKLCVISN